MEFSVVIHPRDQGAVLLSIDPRTAVYASSLDVSNANHVGYAWGAYLSLLDDSPFGRQTKPLRVYRRFSRELLDGVNDLIHRYSEYSDMMLKRPDEFNIGMLSTPVAREYIHWFKTRDSKLYRYLLSFLRLLKRANFERRDLQASAFREWLENEERLSLPLPATALPLLKRVIYAMIGDGPTTTIRRRHGPGLTSDIPHRDAYSKVKNFTMQAHIKRYMSSVFNPSPDPARTVGTILNRFVRWDSEPAPLKSATLTFVPKNYKTMRSICMEPSDAMFAQQGVLDAFYDSFKRRALTRESIILDDQSWNQLGAALGSATSLLDTVDLSSASDLVGVDLIREVFPRKWKYHLLATRTRYARPTRDVEASRTPRLLRKFAPMGSAVCFPVQCVIFLAVVYCVELEQALEAGLITTFELENSSIGELINKVTLRWSSECIPQYDRRKVLRPLVYGDDIVCDAKVTTRVMQRLEELRFRVNHAKSFTSMDPVRESCGKFYYCGEDVTPIRLSTPFIRAGLSAKHTVSLREQAARFHLEGYRSLSRYQFRFWVNNPPRIGNLLTESGADKMSNLFWVGHTVRYNEDLQRKEACVLTAEAVGVNYPKNEEFDGYALFTWQHRSHVDPSRGHTTRVPTSAKHRLEWLPVA